ALPRQLRRLGDRDAQHDHLRARGGVLELSPGARRAEAPGAQVRVQERGAAAGDGAGALARLRPRRRARHRDRLLVPRSRLPDLPRDHERGLLRDPGDLPLHHRRRPRRQLHRRHRLRPHRPAHAARHGRGPDMSSAALDRVVQPKQMGAFREPVHFAFRNRKLVVGLSITTFMLLFAIVGPLFARHPALEYGGKLSLAPTSGGGYWLGTTLLGQDVYAQFVTGLRLAFVVGAVGGGIAAALGMLVGFIGGYRSGVIDELLNMLTNVVLVIPAFALLLVIAAYLQVRGVMTEAVFIGFTSWPWAARAIRAQTFSLVSRDFVEMARLSGRRTSQIIFQEIAPNMSSYLFMTFILLFGNAILIGASLDFVGLGPSNTISLGMMMQLAVQNAALQLGLWWWFLPPWLAITAIVGSLYVMNVGLDEVFNPRLRNM